MVTGGSVVLCLVAACSALSRPLVATRGAVRAAASAVAPECAVLDAIKAEISALVLKNNCGPILIRLSWHDAGVYSDGALKGGCPNAAMRFTDGGEGTFGANAGLDLAIALLADIQDTYRDVISHADLWALASNVAIADMGGPSIPTRFGRVDAQSSAESVESQVGRLPDGDKGCEHLREIFHPKGFDDRDIVALSGAHTVGECKPTRSGFDGAWTSEKYVFDASYFVDMLQQEYAPEVVAATGCPQHRSAKGTIMLESDLALLKAPEFRTHVEAFAGDQALFFAAFTQAWVKLQENGVPNLRAQL